MVIEFRGCQMDLNILGENIDRLITVDIANRGVVHSLYAEARKTSKIPLTLKAAQALYDKIKSNDNILLTTGFLIPPIMKPETDGPPSALIFSKVLNTVFNAKPIIIAEKEALNLISEMSKTVDMKTSASKSSKNNEMQLMGFTLDDSAAQDYATKIIEEFNPSAVIAVEKVGRNHLGIYHNMRGNNVSDRTIKADFLLREASKKGILTIGVGDGGNEIGMGNIEEAVRKYVPNGNVCNCPCQAGIACETKVDHLVVASISNWGLYGIVACLSALTGNISILHSGKVERALLSAAVKNGAIDGVTRKHTPSADGLSSKIHAHIIDILREIALHNT